MGDVLTYWLNKFHANRKMMTPKNIDKYDEWFESEVYPALKDFAATHQFNEKEKEFFFNLMYKVFFFRRKFDEDKDMYLLEAALKRMERGAILIHANH